MVLADACALVDFFTRRASLTAAGFKAMQGEVAISPITVWELTRKVALGKLSPLPGMDGDFAAWLSEQGFLPLPLTWANAVRANTLPPLHKDPAAAAQGPQGPDGPAADRPGAERRARDRYRRRHHSELRRDDDLVRWAAAGDTLSFTRHISVDSAADDNRARYGDIGP
jgi:PIN domain nuclease of toxin-antitoxin system